ncbi:protein TRACHEARY ELEMENT DIFFERENTIATION-RELATED 7-like [Quercus robur]|uniref:protein TRACHEARY ELEMENT DIFFERENTIATION-RELATED 7-like n=1 Tax=Quercus robur TaxID=38942 RepID=UPI00216248C0|nr:protein TRACHEARY ELEMENT DIFFERENTIATION-RELATED 7-like [Quercus robur]
MSPYHHHHHNYTTAIAVGVSLGGAFFLAFLALGLFCLAKKKKKPVTIPVAAAAAACVEEHEHIQETITTNPCGEQTVTVTIDDDVQVHEIASASTLAPPCEPGETGPSTHSQGHQHKLHST